MRPVSFVILMTLAMFPARAAYECNKQAISGPFGFQLSGITTISGSSAPAAGIGRIMFDGDGNISGYSSVNYNGLLLGNPVTGKYEVATDCAMNWSLQDDSGAFQHFSSSIKAGTNRVEFHQTDPGTGVRGILMKTAEACKATDFRADYSFTLSGVSTAVATGGASTNVSLAGAIHTDAEGKLTLTATRRTGSGVLAALGTFEVKSDCFVTFELTLPEPDPGTSPAVKLRGILANGGKEILAIQTDPGESVSARFTAR
jgi:hypothetical protein